ncbi:LysM peptidoglycan-binding domain-containing protein [Gordonia crocea]|uniref:LysM domain-containing protein n=1 Tax=Gordonia crocea TaxID=589162 RepID=A0A7I9UZ16_9ACTN|nr:LysM peptidoglycan-binding domain-containing protein [Gordonia crocea]GED98159.1 hypothetical protein nbrc107697_21980 [Gordonia crocea]
MSASVMYRPGHPHHAVPTSRPIAAAGHRQRVVQPHRGPARSEGRALRGPRDTRLPAPRPGRGSECTGPAHGRPRVARPAPDSRVFARRKAAAAILVGAALAGLVWLFAIVGGNYEAASAPAPVATSVVHVRGGETLTAVAARIAPDMPRQAVVNQLRALNSMTSPTLTVGQALVVPVYR